MMDENTLQALAREIMEQGYDEKTAWRYAALIGDLPVSDTNGNIVVSDEKGRELARLKPLNYFS